jgi:hypothetical protein
MYWYGWWVYWRKHQDESLNSPELPKETERWPGKPWWDSLCEMDRLGSRVAIFIIHIVYNWQLLDAVWLPLTEFWWIISPVTVLKWTFSYTFVSHRNFIMSSSPGCVLWTSIPYRLRSEVRTLVLVPTSPLTAHERAVLDSLSLGSKSMCSISKTMNGQKKNEKQVLLALIKPQHHFCVLVFKNKWK